MGHNSLIPGLEQCCPIKYTLAKYGPWALEVWLMQLRTQFLILFIFNYFNYK